MTLSVKASVRFQVNFEEGFLQRIGTIFSYHVHWKHIRKGSLRALFKRSVALGLKRVAQVHLWTAQVNFTGSTSDNLGSK